MPEIKTYYDFFNWFIETLFKTKSNNVIWNLSFSTEDDLWKGEEPWVDIVLLIDDNYYSTIVYEGELTDEIIKYWNEILQSALDSKSTEYNLNANLVHNAIRTIIESGQDLDPDLIALRNELQKG
jgi:hypothetical protein